MNESQPVYKVYDSAFGKRGERIFIAGPRGFAIARVLSACLGEDQPADCNELVRRANAYDALRTAIANYLSEEDAPLRDFTMLRVRREELRAALKVAEEK